MTETIEIPLKKYKRLLKSEEKLNCLEAAGVDNWEGYDFAMEDFYDDDDE